MGKEYWIDWFCEHSDLNTLLAFKEEKYHTLTYVEKETLDKWIEAKQNEEA